MRCYTHSRQSGVIPNVSVAFDFTPTQYTKKPQTDFLACWQDVTIVSGQVCGPYRNLHITQVRPLLYYPLTSTWLFAIPPSNSNHHHKYSHCRRSAYS